ncbi:MAG: TIGR04282 family arsenosugar biosynthesis glycosyltransferase [Oscillospiraceae bacterium]|nr:TIGR04282 family arsenosugar biosynthesis glycosyltransferase [Oscillospiraceae bacterium]
MKRAVICFTRVPRPGVTKTRLLPILTPDQCAELHWAFLKDLSNVYREIDADLFIAYTPDPNWAELKAVFPTAAGFFPQEGAGLGEKMDHALCRVLDLGYDAVVLTGADLPAMGQAHLESGFAALASANIAIGPTSDGGYYLVGAKAPCAAIFTGQQYGGATVYENTLAAARAAGYSVAPALPCDDVDTPADLRNLAVSPVSHNGQFLETLRKEGIL